MKDNLNGNSPPLGKRGEREPDADSSGVDARISSTDGQARNAPRGHPSANPFSFWILMDLLAQRWHWVAVGSAVCAAAFYLLGWHLIKPKFTAEAQLFRNEPPGWSEFFKTPAVSGDTLSAIISSPDLLRRVGTNVEPNIPAEKLARCIKVEPETDSDLIKVFLAAGEPQQAVNLLNAYTREAVEFTREMQRQLAEVVANDYLKEQVTQMNQDISALQDRFRGAPDASQLTIKASEFSSQLGEFKHNLTGSRPPPALIRNQKERLGKAWLELNELLVKYTERHPSVIGKQEEIDELTKRLASYSTNSNWTGPDAATVDAVSPLIRPGGAVGLDPETDILRVRLTMEEQARVQLVNRQREAERYAFNASGMVKVHAPATMNTVKANMRSVKIGAISVFGGLLGLAGSLILVLLVEIADNRLKNADDLRRVTKLPVLTSLGDVHGMTPADRSQWAFRTWMMLQGRLSPSPNHGLVCGITSSAEREGRSTWISLLAEAASLSGFRVLTIATRPSPTNGASDDAETPLLEGPDMHKSDNENKSSNGNFNNGQANNPSTALTSNVLTSPARVTEQLTGPNSQPVVHIPLPGWVWNLERRKQWREALNHWRTIENLVILVELPPASVPEAVLLGCNLPNLVWLADSGTAEAAETRAQLETLRHARCNLVGAVLNRELAPSLKKRFPRWLDSFALLLALGVCSAQGQDTNTVRSLEAPASLAAEPSETQTKGSFSIVNPSQRAAWQQRLTVGPGDVVTFGLFDHPELTITEVAIAPDGMVNYLEATNVLATGLTIDELRAKLDQELGNYRRAPRTMITPIAFRSKKYYMLGKVMTKGVYTLDRPMTVLEAIARAHGLENGMVDRNVIDLADFQRSFLMRGGKRIPLNFEKLFQDGDLSQNMAIEPGDYIYFPSTNVKDVYVVGEVRLPGTVIYHPSLTIIGAISARGGYTDRAFKARVLVVRGSINHPETFAVDTHAILDGKAPDFRLRAKDIIYVNSRPFILVEELADLATTAFIQSLITSVVGIDVVKPFSK